MKTYAPPVAMLTFAVFLALITNQPGGFAKPSTQPVELPAGSQSDQFQYIGRSELFSAPLHDSQLPLAPLSQPLILGPFVERNSTTSSMIDTSPSSSSSSFKTVNDANKSAEKNQLSIYLFANSSATAQGKNRKEPEYKIGKPVVGGGQ